MHVPLTSNKDLLIAWFVLFGGALLVAAVYARVAAWTTARVIRRRLLKAHTIIPEYEPPADTLPFELGYLYDNKFGDNELYSVLLGLAQKRVVALEFSTAKDFTITAVSPLSQEQLKTLSDVEITIWTAVRDMPEGMAEWRSISGEASEATGVQADFEAATKKQLEQKGYLAPGSMLAAAQERKTAIKIASLLLAVGLVAVPLLVVRQAAQATGAEPGFASLDRGITEAWVLLAALFAWPLLYGYCHMLVYTYLRSAGLPIGSTAKLREAWPRVVGYRLYVRTVEWPKLKSRMELQSALLPYCLAFGLYPRSISQPTDDLK